MSEPPPVEDPRPDEPESPDETGPEPDDGPLGEVEDAARAALARARASISAVTAIGNGRFALEIPLTTAPERLIPELVAAGAQLVSLNPIRATLEDYFVATVQSVRDERDRDRRGGLADRARWSSPVFRPARAAGAWPTSSVMKNLPSRSSTPMPIPP